jgi:hypothetical protein
VIFGGEKSERGPGMVAWRVEWLVVVVGRSMPFQLMWVMMEEVKISRGVVRLVSPVRAMVLFLVRRAERTR